MADWTANSSFGALSATREPVFRAMREAPKAAAPQALRAERAMPFEDPAPRVSPGVAALAEYNAAADGPLAKARLAVWAGGGLVSLALVAGIGVWGYKLVLREVLGLPVVAAVEGPMRILPADPGGEVVPSQGLAVNAIPAAGTVAPPSDVLVLAPQTAGLAEEDMEVVVQTNAEADEVMPAAEPVTLAAATTPEPVAAAPLDAGPALVAEPLPTVAEALPAAVLPAPEAVEAAPLDAATPADAAAALPVATPAPAEQPARLVAALLPADHEMTTEEILAFADQISAGAEPLAPTDPALEALSTEEVEAVASLAVAAIPAEVPGVAAAPKPPARPATLAAARSEAPAAQSLPSAPAPQPAAAAGNSGVALTASLPSGTHLVQLGAFDSAEIAASEWERLQGRFGDFLGEKARVIQETQSNGQTLYRLRATGFDDRAEARVLCAALTAEGAACIPVTVD